MKPSVPVRIAAGLALLVVILPSLLLVTFTAMAFRDGFEPIGVPFLVGAIGGFVGSVQLYRVVRGELLGGKAKMSMMVGVLAAGATFLFAQRQLTEGFNKRHVTAMRSDLRNLADAQDAYHRQHGTYAGDLALIPDYKGSTGVTLVLERADSSSWSARTTHSAVRRRSCQMVARLATISDGPVCQ
jgi:hypothetical protein